MCERTPVWLNPCHEDQGSSIIQVEFPTIIQIRSVPAISVVFESGFALTGHLQKSQAPCPPPLIALNLTFSPTLVELYYSCPVISIKTDIHCNGRLFHFVKKNNSTHPLLQCCHLCNRCFGMAFFCRRFSCRQLPRQRLIGCLQLLNRRPKMTSMTNAERLDLINLQHI